MTKDFVLPKGRMTIRKNGGRRVRLWELASSNPTVQRLEAAYLGAINAVDVVEEHKASTLKSGKYTPQGAADDTLKFALTKAIPAFKRGRDAIAAAKREAAALRDKIKLREPDKSDLAGAMLRREIRDRLSAMSAKHRDRFMNENLERMDPVVAEAILTAPAWLSGVSNSHRNLLTEKALEAQFGDAVLEAQELERAIDITTSAVETGRDEIRIETGVLDPNKFEQLAAPVEAKRSAPWLRRSKTSSGAEEIVVVDLDRGIERPATSEEVERGIFYNDFEHYKEGKAA